MKVAVLAEPVLVGREKELEELQCYLDSAIEWKGRTVFVSGEAGSGKTRLITEFLNKARKQGITVLTGWCLSNAAVPYFPFFEAFNAFFSSEHAEEDKQTRRQTLRSQTKQKKPKGKGSEEAEVTAWLMGPSQAEKLGVRAMSPQVWKDQTFAAVAKTLAAISSRKTIILFIDDLHWADSASLTLIHYIARSINSERILLLATFRIEHLTPDAEGRPHPLVETLRLMKREDLFREIKVSNLNRTSVFDLAENVLGGDLQRDFAEKLSEDSQGNPLFVVESLRMLYERGGLIRENGQWRLSVDALGIPPKIKDVILQRLDVLPRDQRRVLDAASVIGEKFSVELLASILGLDCLEATETLDTIAKNTSLVHCEGELYRFDHARSRDAVYEEISPALKRGYHGRIAERLETQDKSKGLPLADLAYHYAQTQDEEKAIKYSLAAGKEALARWSNTEAAKHFQYVLQRIGDIPERVDERMIALEGLGDAYYAADNFSQAASVFVQLASLESGADKLRVLRKAMFAAFYLGDMPLLAELTQKAEENATADRLEAGRVLHQKARVLGIQGDIPTCTMISEEALKIFEEEYALSDAAWILFTIGSNLSMLGQAERGVEAALRSIALYDELRDVLAQMEAYLYASFAFSNSGLVGEDKRMGDKVIELNEKFRLCDYIRLIPVYAYSSLAHTRTDIPGSISRALKALEYAEKTDSSLYLGIIYEVLTIVYAFTEDMVHMEEYFEKLMNLPKDVLSNVFTRSFLEMATGVYYAAKNDFEKSNEYFKCLLQDTISLRMSPHMLMHGYFCAWALNRQGRIDEAKILLEEIEDILERTRERFSHVNVHASLMTFTHPEVDQIFEMRLDLVNVSRSHGSIVNVENLIVPGLAITEVSPNCLIHDGIVEFKDKTISRFEVKTVKLTLKGTKPGSIQLTPRVKYEDDLGKTKTSSTRTFTINVQPAQPKYQVPSGRVPTGLEELDALLFGGIPEHCAVVLTSPSNDEREILIRRFLEVRAETVETTFCVTAEAASTRALIEMYPSNFYLFLCNPQSDAMIRNAPNVVKLKGVENLTDIDIALNKAFRTLDLSAKGPRRILIDVVSDILLQHHPVTTRRWLSSLLSTLKLKGFTVLATVNPRMHPPEEYEAIIGLFDGEISICEKETPKGVARSLRIKKMTGQKYLKNEVPLTGE